MSVYYNEWEPYCAEWLRNLIREGLIADGDVDERSIEDVEPADLRGYTQCHFFAGIGGWSYALRLAGWPDDRHVWTGSCPCQDFSVAGKREGFGGNRDLWPSWFRLINKRSPNVVFGEQVANAPEWVDRAASNMENQGYAFGALVVPAHAIGASHRRARLWFVADANSNRLERGGSRGGAREASRSPARGETGRTHNAVAAFPHRREFSFIGEARRVGREESIRWNGCWEAAPQPFVCSGSNGIPGRMGQLRAYGNAIVPQVAAEFIGAYMDASA